VPDDVLVLGVDNDVTLCEMSTPTLSSIQLTSYDAGYRLAEVLDRAMRGEIAPGKMPDVPYTGNTVIERVSTQRSFAYDTLVRRCREILATEFAAPIRVADLATRFRVSRRTLETHFRAMTGTTIAEEVMRLRIEHAKRLLATTDAPQERIASACGFYNASHLSAVFRRRCGAPPSSFR
jgi:LacI family transcriptional regulator